MKLIAGGDLAINQAINLGTGDLFLDVAGNVTQTAPGTITAGGLALMVDGTTRLQLGNDVNVLAANTGDTVLYNDLNGLTIGTVTVLDGTGDQMQIIGITTTNDDVKLIAGGDLAINQAINLGAGDLFLDVAGNVTQTAPGTITAGGLALMVDGTTRLQLGNDVNVLAANTGDTVLYNDLNGLTIGTVTVLDGTGDQMQIIGITTTNDDVKLITGGDLAINQAINLGTGDLFLDVAGNVTQTAPGTITAGGLAVMVDGTTRLQLGNDVDTLAANTGDTILYNDVDGLVIGTVTVLDGTGDQMQIIGITTTNDDVKLITGGDLAINLAINLGTGDLFLDVAGNVTQTAPGTITAGGLALMVDGTTRLQLGNDVNVLAANTGDTVLYNDINGLTIGTVTVLDGTGDQMQIIGITTTNDDVKLIAGGNLAINQAINLGTGDLFLDVAGNVTQTAPGTITAGGLALMVDGTTRLQLGNDVNVLAANTGDTVLYNDLNGLTIGTVTVLDGTGDQMQIIGITTTNDDVKLIAGGDLAINQAINLGTGDLFLDVAGNVTQTAPGTITAGGLALMVDGTTRLQLGNDVNVLAANTGDTVLFNDLNGLTIGTVTVLDGTGDQMQIIGITTTNDDVKLIAGGDLAINQAINLGTGDLFLDVAGNVTQTAPGTITAGGLALMVDGTTRLQLGNDVDMLAANTGDTILYNDVDGLTIGTVTVLDGTGDQMQIIGITTTNDDVKLIAGGDLAINQAINLGTGDLFLDVAGNVTQTAPGTITAGGLALMVDGTTRLQLGNDVNLLAANTGDTVLFNDLDGLTIGTVTVLDGTGDQMQIIGITTTNDDVKLIAGGNLAINQAINLGAGDLFLDVAGNVTQTAPGTITAGGLALMVDGATRLQLGNDVNVLAANTGDTVLYNDINGLAIGTVTVLDGTGDQMQVAGITTIGDDVKVIAGGNLSINQAISLGSGDLLLDVAGNVTQTALGTITAGGLALMIDGNTTLQLDNDVDRLAADNGDTILFNDIDELTVSTVTVLDGTGDAMEIVGITTSDDNVFVQTGSYLSIEERIDAGGGAVRLVANGDITQTTTGVIIANDLGVRQQGPMGDVLLCYDNQVNLLSVFNPVGAINFNNIQDLAIGTVASQTIGGITFDITTGISAVGNQVIVRADGDLQIGQAIIADNVRLIGNGNITQTASGTITSNMLGVRQESLTNGDIILDDGNDVDIFAAHNDFDSGFIVFNDIDDLTIASVAQLMFCDQTFEQTVGIEGRGDILIRAGGFLVIQETIQADNGLDDVRLIANGNITQTPAGIIIADNLGVRQENTIGISNILLDQVNDVKTLSARNLSDGGVIVFNDTDQVATINFGLSIESLTSQSIGNISFATTDGVSTTFIGAAIAGAADVDSGDILINSDGFLQINDQVNAGNADVRLTANGDLVQSVNGSLTANELGVRQRASMLNSNYDLDGNNQCDILLNEASGGNRINDVDNLAMVNYFRDGNLLMGDMNDLTIDQVSAQAICNVSFEIVIGVTSDDGMTGTPTDGVGDITLEADESLNDGDNIPIITGGQGFFRGDNEIELADQVGDQLKIGGTASFQSADIQVGQDSSAAGNGNVLFGSLKVNDLGTGTGTADITEDDGTLLTGENSTGTLILTSANNITNANDTFVKLDHVQFNAENGTVFMGNQPGDRFESRLNDEIEIGTLAIDVSIAADSSVEINGMDPTIDNQPHDMTAGEFDLGTRVTETLFVTSAGHIEQTIGNLNAKQLGLDAVNHVHLESVSANNILLAINAGDSTVNANLASHRAVLDALALIDGSEVRPDLVQSISVMHQGSLILGSVVNPDLGNRIDGISVVATDDGSVFLMAQDLIAINNDVTATSSGSLPQVTAYVQNAAANDASRITFSNDAAIRVTGTNGSETNHGVVNFAQTEAFFGIDTDGNGAIDKFFFDANMNGILDSGEISFETTFVIRLDAGTDSAEQKIESIYGHPGEEGYRFAFVWDSQRRFDAGFPFAQEDPNLYTTNATSDSELFNVWIVNPDNHEVMLVVIGSEAFQTALIEMDSPQGGNFNFDTVFEKVLAWTRIALSERTDDPRVFTTVEVRNDQDINLFVGNIGSADNSLNAVSQTLEARIETPGYSMPSTPFVFVVNPVPVQPPLEAVQQLITYIETIDQPELNRLEDPGRLSFIAVEIDNPDDPDDAPEDHMLEVDGELILKDPQIEYDPLNKDELPEIITEADKNEYQKIIEKIENDPNAETGLWYKVFIDYRDPGKKDELLFYYYKTGERPDQDLGPASDFQEPSPPADALPDEPNTGDPAIEGPATDQDLNATPG